MEKVNQLMRLKQWMNKKTLRSVLIAAGSLLLGMGSYAYYKELHTTSYFEVLREGQVIGEISDPSLIQEAIDKKKDTLIKDGRATYVLQTGRLSYRPCRTYNFTVNNKATLKKIDKLMKVYACAVSIQVDQKHVGYVKDEVAASQLLKKIQQKYLPKVTDRTVKVKHEARKNMAPITKLEDIFFVEKIANKKEFIAPDQLEDVKELLKKLSAGEASSSNYTVEKGDSLWSIARKFKTTEEKLYLNNPEIKGTFIDVGQKINIEKSKPTLTVKSIETQVHTNAISPLKKIKKDAKLAAGTRKIVQAGKPGLKQVSYRVVKENGCTVSETRLGEKILNASLPEIIIIGTKSTIANGSGQFSWPVNGARVSSPFGRRGRRVHRGVDLTSGNRSILAADSGTIEYAGRRNGYGNTVIINHRNGYRTVYAHLRTINVRRGQSVGKREKIGIMGNTGQSHGIHLHFEVHRNGVAQNPMKFLGRK